MITGETPEGTLARWEREYPEQYQAFVDAHAAYAGMRSHQDPAAMRAAISDTIVELRRLDDDARGLTPAKAAALANPRVQAAIAKFAEDRSLSRPARPVRCPLCTTTTYRQALALGQSRHRTDCPMSGLAWGPRYS